MSNSVQWFVSNVQQKDSCVSINKLYLQATNYDYNMAIFLSQVVFWTGGQSKLGSGKFYKTDQELGDELGFSRQQIKRLKSKLLNLPVGDFFSFRSRKINGTPTTHWEIDFNCFCDYFFEHFSGKKQPKKGENEDVAVDSNGLVEIDHSIDWSKSTKPTIYRSLPDTKSCPLSEFNQLIRDAFEHWWSLYPSERRSDKQGCFSKWERLCNKLTEDEIIKLADDLSIDIVKRLEDCDDLKFYPTTPAYLQKKRWEDG